MTSEERLLFSPKDILAVRLNCAKCRTVRAVPPDSWKNFPYLCSNCGEQWMQNETAEARALQSFINILQQLRAIDNDRFSIQFELARPRE